MQNKKFSKSSTQNRGEYITVMVPSGSVRDGALPEGSEEQFVEDVNKRLASMKNVRNKSFDFPKWLDEGGSGLRQACELITGTSKTFYASAADHIGVLLVLLNNKVVTKADLTEFVNEESLPNFKLKVVTGLITKVLEPSLKGNATDIPCLGYLPASGTKSGPFSIQTGVFAVRDFMKTVPIPNEMVKEYARTVLLWSRDRYSKISNFEQFKDKKGNAITAADVKRITAAITVVLDKMDSRTSLQAIVSCLGLTFGARPSEWSSIQ